MWGHPERYGDGSIRTIVGRFAPGDDVQSPSASWHVASRTDAHEELEFADAARLSLRGRRSHRGLCRYAGRLFDQPTRDPVQRDREHRRASRVPV